MVILDFQTIIGLILVQESGQNPLSTLTAPIMHKYKLTVIIQDDSPAFCLR